MDLKSKLMGAAKSGSGKSMKVGTKVMAVVGFCLALLIMVAGTSIWQMNLIGGEIEGIAERDIPLTEALPEFQREVQHPRPRHFNEFGFDRDGRDRQILMKS